jgi:hypothetical protein
MEALRVPAPLHERLGNAGSDGLMTMFTDVHRMGEERLDRRIAEVCARFDARLVEEMSKMRLEMASLKLEVLKWSFLFWIGQVAVLVSVLSWMLRGVR